MALFKRLALDGCIFSLLVQVLWIVVFFMLQCAWNCIPYHTAEAGSHELPGSLVHSKQVLNISGGIAQW